MSKVKILGMEEMAAADVAAGDMVPIVDVSETDKSKQNKKLDLKGYVDGASGIITRTFTDINSNQDLVTLDENGDHELIYCETDFQEPKPVWRNRPCPC